MQRIHNLSKNSSQIPHQFFKKHSYKFCTKHIQVTMKKIRYTKNTQFIKKKQFSQIPYQFSINFHTNFTQSTFKVTINRIRYIKNTQFIKKINK